MGFFDKLKGAVHAVTGGAATVDIQYAEKATAGQTIPVKVTVTSKGAEIKSKGVFVDFRGAERIAISKRDDSNLSEDFHRDLAHSKQEFKLCGEFVLGAGETKSFEGTVSLPPNLQPSYEGRFTKNVYEVQGRLEAKGNDPDSGWKPLRVVIPA
jgi:sporulation-control protein spo0M